MASDTTVATIAVGVMTTIAAVTPTGTTTIGGDEFHSLGNPACINPLLNLLSKALAQFLGQGLCLWLARSVSLWFHEI